jgi:hypothetical protein
LLRKAVLDEAGGEAPPAGAYGEAARDQGLAITAAVQNSLLRKAVLDEAGGEAPRPGAYGEAARDQGHVPDAAIQSSLQRGKNVTSLDDLSESHYDEWVKNALLFNKKDLTISGLKVQTELVDDTNTVPPSSFSSSSSLSVFYPSMPPASSSSSASLSSSSTPSTSLSSHLWGIFRQPSDRVPSLPGSWAKASIESIFDSNSKSTQKQNAAKHMCNLFRAEVKLANLRQGTVVFGFYGFFNDGSLMQARVTTDRGIVREAFKKAQPATAHGDSAGRSLNLLEKKASETPGFAVLTISKTGLVGKLFAVFCYVV